MAVSIVGTSSGNSGSATDTSFVTAWPAGYTAVANDVAIMFGHVSGTSLTMNPGAGWTAIDGITNPVNQSTNSRMYGWRRVLTAGESAPTITNSGSVTGGWEIVICRGANTTDPIGQAGSATASAAGSVNIASLTGVLAGSALVVGAQCRVASGTIPTGWSPDADYTEQEDHATSRSTASANQRMTAATRLIASAGNYGGDTFTATGATGSIVAFHVEVLAASTVVDGAAVLGAVATATLVPRIQTRASGTLTAAGLVAGAARVQVRASSTLAAAGTATAAPVMQTRASSTLAAISSATAAARLMVRATAQLGGVGTMTGDGTVGGEVTGDAQLVAVATATLVPRIVTRGSAALAAAGSATLDGRPQVRAGAVLAALAGANLAPRLVIPASASLTAVATLTGTVSAGATARRTATPTGRRTAAGTARRAAAAGTQRRG